MGRFDEAISEAKRAEELEPLSFISNSHLGWILYLAGRNDEAIAHCTKLLDVDPNFFPARRYIGLAYEQKGMYPEAIDQFQQGVKLSGSPLILSLLGHVYGASGRKADAQRVLAELDQQNNDMFRRTPSRQSTRDSARKTMPSNGLRRHLRSATSG